MVAKAFFLIIFFINGKLIKYSSSLCKCSGNSTLLIHLKDIKSTHLASQPSAQFERPTSVPSSPRLYGGQAPSFRNAY